MSRLIAKFLFEHSFWIPPFLVTVLHTLSFSQFDSNISLHVKTLVEDKPLGFSHAKKSFENNTSCRVLLSSYTVHIIYLNVLELILLYTNMAVLDINSHQIRFCLIFETQRKLVKVSEYHRVSVNKRTFCIENYSITPPL